jgi:hypothetical protein
MKCHKEEIWYETEENVRICKARKFLFIVHPERGNFWMKQQAYKTNS